MTDNVLTLLTTASEGSWLTGLLAQEDQCTQRAGSQQPVPAQNTCGNPVQNKKKLSGQRRLHMCFPLTPKEHPKRALVSKTILPLSFNLRTKLPAMPHFAVARLCLALHEPGLALANPQKRPPAARCNNRAATIKMDRRFLF